MCHLEKSKYRHISATVWAIASKFGTLAHLAHLTHYMCHVCSIFCSILFISRPRSEGWPHHGRTFSISLSSVIPIDSSTVSPVHVLMLSIQAVRGLPRLRAPGLFPACELTYMSDLHDSCMADTCTIYVNICVMVHIWHIYVKKTAVYIVMIYMRVCRKTGSV